MNSIPSVNVQYVGGPQTCHEALHSGFFQPHYCLTSIIATEFPHLIWDCNAPPYHYVFSTILIQYNSLSKLKSQRQRGWYASHWTLIRFINTENLRPMYTKIRKMGVFAQISINCKMPHSPFCVLILFFSSTKYFFLIFASLVLNYISLPKESKLQITYPTKDWYLKYIKNSQILTIKI